VKYVIPQSVGSAWMTVYDLTGKQITKFAITEKGNASLTVTAEKLQPGIYIYSIVADGKVIDSKRMIVADK
jgi:trimeric autotransporter adhesin